MKKPFTIHILNKIRFGSRVRKGDLRRATPTTVRWFENIDWKTNFNNKVLKQAFMHSGGRWNFIMIIGKLENNSVIWKYPNVRGGKHWQKICLNNFSSLTFTSKNVNKNPSPLGFSSVNLDANYKNFVYIWFDDFNAEFCQPFFLYGKSILQRLLEFSLIE